MAIDLASVILSLQTHAALTVRRPAFGSYSGGLWTAGADTVFTVIAVCYPATGEATQLLPEAERTTEALVVYSLTQLQPTVADGQLGDIVQYNGRDWRVLVAEDWDTSGNYYRSVATRIGQ